MCKVYKYTYFLHQDVSLHFYSEKIKSKFYVCFVQPEIEEWSSWDEDAPTSIKIEGGNGNVSASPNDENEEPDYFKDMAPTIRKTQKVFYTSMRIMPRETN